MADFTRDPIEAEHIPTYEAHRLVHSSQQIYTSAGGALDIVTDNIFGYRNALKVHWMELDISASNASYNHVVTMEFPAGHEYENHIYLIKDTFAGSATNLHQVLYAGAGGITVPAGAIFRLVATNSVALATFKFHILFEVMR